MKIAVLGSGNGGHAVAFEWALAGHEVYMFDFDKFPKAIGAIAAAGGIYSEGELEGFQKIAYAGHDIEKVITGAELIFAVGPAYSTEPFGLACKPYVAEGQTYVVCPGSCMGSVVFKKALGYAVDDPRVTVSETSTLPYAVRIVGDAKIAVYNRLPGGYLLASLPRTANDKVFAELKPVFFGIEKGVSVLQTTLQNANPVLHPSIATLNAGRIEDTEGKFFFYENGVTPSVGRMICAMDDERILLGKHLGFVIESDPGISQRQGYMIENNYDNAYRTAPGFKGIVAPNTLDYRFFNEDAGFGLVLWVDLAHKMGVDVPVMEAMLTVASVIRGRDYRAEQGRTLAKLGLDGYTVDQLKAIL